VLAGESRAYADEVEGCFGVRPTWTDEAVFEAAHERLEELLPGHGPLAERYERWEESMRVPPDRVERVVAAAIEAARAWTGRTVGLPPGEGVVSDVAHDVPWMAFCEYLGGLRSRISVNVSLSLSAIEVLVIVAHETYPGHHAERCCKEDELVRRRGLLEETLVLVPTPQSLVSEGIAKLAPSLLLESDAGPALAAVMHDAGIELDLERALEVRRAVAPCEWAEVNGALLLNERGADEGEVRAYMERWGLLTSELSAHVFRFFGEPTSRTYIVTYPAGLELCRSYVAGEAERFRRLLTEQVRVRDLVEAHEAAAPAAG
jgi:hypothetical protein